MTTSLSLVHQRKNKEANTQKLSTNLTLYEAYITTGQTLGGQKPKGRNKSTLKPGNRRPQIPQVNSNSNEKAEKYCSNEGTN